MFLFVPTPGNQISCKCLKRMAGTTGLEPAASAVTGQRSNQLNYVPTRQINQMRPTVQNMQSVQSRINTGDCLCLPKRALLLAEPLTNRPQISQPEQQATSEGAEMDSAVLTVN